MAVDQAKLNRYKLAGLLGIPFVIMALAYIVYFSGVGIPAGTTNKGVLITPPPQIGDIGSLRPQPFPAKDTKLWYFIVPGDAVCDDACRQRLYLTRQTRIALGKYTPRVQRIYLNVSGEEPNAELQEFIATEHADLKNMRASKKELVALLDRSEAGPQNLEEIFYVADPEGFMMMYYTPELSGKDILKDMKFLLKFSQE